MERDLINDGKIGLPPAYVEIANDLIPWQLTGSGLGSHEDEELAKRRAMPATITKEGVPMAGQTLVKGAARALELIRKNQPRATKLSEYYQKATGKVVDFTSAAQVAAIAKGPAPAAVILRGAVSAGMNPGHVFDDAVVSQADKASAQIINELFDLFNQVSAVLDVKATIHSDGSFAASMFKKEVMMFAQKQFGTPKSIREAHAKLRAFLEMDSASLNETLVLHLGS